MNLINAYYLLEILLKKYLLIWEVEREREKETLSCCSTHSYTHTGWFLYVPWQGIEPTTPCTGMML